MTDPPEIEVAHPDAELTDEALDALAVLLVDWTERDEQ